MPPSLSLLQTLAQVPDPRGRQGRRHPLSAILSLTVLSMLTGCKSWEALVPFGRDHGAALAHALGFRRGKTPAKSTLCDLLRALDVAAFEAILSRWIAQRVPAENYDGRRPRNSPTKNQVKRSLQPPWFTKPI